MNHVPWERTIIKQRFWTRSQNIVVFVVYNLVIALGRHPDSFVRAGMRTGRRQTPQCQRRGLDDELFAAEKPDRVTYRLQQRVRQLEFKYKLSEHRKTDIIDGRPINVPGENHRCLADDLIENDLCGHPKTEWWPFGGGERRGSFNTHRFH